LRGERGLWIYIFVGFILLLCVCELRYYILDYHKYNIQINRIRFFQNMATTISLNLIQSTNISSYDNNNATAVRGMASSKDGRIMYVAITENNVGIIISTNYGVTWTNSNQTIGLTSIACSSDGNIVYAAHLGVGLIKSTNSGNTWNYIFGGTLGQTPLPGIEGYTSDNVYQITCDETGTKLFMTTNGARTIYYSSDGGVSWSGVYSIPNISEPYNPQTPFLVTSNMDCSVLYAAFNNTDRKIYKSFDFGVTWNIINTIGNVPGPFASISTNSTGDFLFATDTNGVLNIFYETHAARAVFVPSNNRFTTISSYNNGNNILLMNDINSTETYSFQNLYPPGLIPGTIPVIPCFKSDSKILCYKNGYEIYVDVQNLRKGDLLKTFKHGYVAVNMIGTSKMYNSGNLSRGKNRLYKCTSEHYPEMIEEDLILTGCHSILMQRFATSEQREKTREIIGQIYLTDGKVRLPACVDERAVPYEVEGVFDIWHIALENDDYYMNYGIYANGLLVETCSKRFLKELSGMTLIH